MRRIAVDEERGCVAGVAIVAVMLDVLMNGRFYSPEICLWPGVALSGNKVGAACLSC